MFDVAVVSQILWTSFATSSYFVLFAVAFALVLKVNKVFNFAQAGVMTCGFYAAYVAVRLLEWPGFAGLLAGIAGALLMSFILEYFGFAVLRQRKASPMFVFIFTLIVSQFISYAIMLVFGTWPTTIFASMFWPVTLVGGIAVSAWDVPAIAATLVVLIALWVFLRFTRYGQFMLAVADNADLAELYGIQKNKVLMISMLMAGVIVAIGMFLYGSRAQVQAAAATELMLFAVASTILGGIGKIWGAAVAAIILGFCYMPFCFSPLCCFRAAFACPSAPTNSNEPSAPLMRSSRSRRVDHGLSLFDPYSHRIIHHLGFKL